MTAGKPSPQGDPCGLFLSWVRPSPRPRKGTCGSASPRKGEPPVPREKRGGCLIRRGQPAPAGDWGTAPPGWELVPGELENSLLSKGDLREVPLRGRGSHPPPRKTGRVSHSPEEARPCRELGNRPAGLGLFQGSLRIPRPRKGTCGKCLPGERISRPPPEKNGEGPVP